MTLTRKQKLQILERQDFRCLGCRRTITLDAYRLRDWKKILGYYPDPSVPSKAYFHHKKQRKYGGSDNPNNIVATCGRCHSKAHDYYKRFKV